MTFRTETIGECTLILGDCLEVLPTLPAVDAVVTDPPYGIGGTWNGGNSHGWGKFRGAAAIWDKRPEWLTGWVSELDVPTIIWGGNYYSLPPSDAWLVWDKINRIFSGGHAELAWTNLRQPIRAFNLARNHFTPAFVKTGEIKRHPTQKPLPLMEWCLGFVPNAQTVLDPFMGSGTTLVACAKLGRRGIGIEIEPRYFDIACRRVEEAYRQPRLELPEPVKPVQEAMAI